MGLPTIDVGSHVKEGWSTLIALDGSNNPEYIGLARAIQPTVKTVLAGVGFTNIVDSSNLATVTWTAHGLATGNRVTVSGCTEDLQLNGTYIITVTGADAFTFVSASVTDATYDEAGLAISTTAPSTSDPVWSIQKFVYSGAYQVGAKWQEGRSDANGIWLNRASLAYQ